MKSCFEGQKRECIYHSYKSLIICVSLFCVLPLLGAAREIQHPIPQGNCPHRHSNEARRKTGEGGVLSPFFHPLWKDLTEWYASNHGSQLP